MRILLLTHYYSPESGAPQRRWDSLIREFVAAGHEIAVICPPPHHPGGTVPEEFRQHYRRGSATRDENGARVFRTGYLPHRGDIVTRTLDHLVTAQRMIARATRVIRRGIFVPDVIIATAPAIPTLIAGDALSRRFGIPCIDEMRDAWPDLVTHVAGMSAGRGPTAWVKQLVHRGVTRMQGASAHVVTTTQAFADVLTTRGLDKVAVVRNGTNPSTFADVPPLDTSHQELRALYMGTMGRSQGLDVVIRAAHELQKRGIPVALRLIGDGHERKALMKLNQQLGNPAQILPRVGPSALAAHYAWADTTIATLRDWEPFAWTIPSKLYELLSTGRHVTGILAGEGADVLTQANGGDVVPPGSVDALVEMWQGLATDKSRLDVGNSGRDWVKNNVAYEKLASKYYAILESVVN